MKTRHQRHEEAVARQKLYDARTPQQQLALLDRKFGKGVGAKKERARLNRLINALTNEQNRKRSK